MSNQPSPNDSPSDPARQLRQLIEPDQQSRLELDSELLERYLQAGDRAAMERLVHRYAPLVASVCRLGTGCDQDAQDAFQATFLVLLQSARKIRRRSSLAAWLYGVAFRIAGRVRCQRMRSAAMITSGPNVEPSIQDDPLLQLARRIDLDLLDRELQQLPDKLQGPLVEHYLLGYSVPEIAERMDLNITTIEGRLRRGRALLRTRLARRGISLSVALAGAGWFQQGLHAADASSWSAAFIEGTWEAGQTQVDPSSDPTLLSLVEGELSMLSVGSKSLLAAGLLIVFGSCLTAGLLLGGDGAPQAAVASTEVKAAATPAAPTEASFYVHVPAAELLVTDATPTADTAAQFSVQVPAAVKNDRAFYFETGFAADSEVVQPSVFPGGIATFESSATGPGDWQRPTGPLPAWLAGSTSLDKVEQRVEQVRQRLYEDVTEPLEFDNVPLGEVIERLSELTGSPIYINVTELDSEGIDPSTTVSIRLPVSSLREALRRVLSDLHLTYCVRESGIEITTESAAERQGATRFYDLSYLLPDSTNAQAIVNTVTHHIEPDSWQAQGGSYSITMVGSVLIVSCSEQMHHDIQVLLANLAKLNASNTTPAIGPVIAPGMGGMGGGMF